MRIVDAGGEKPEARIVKDFNAADISDLPFGWNFPNYVLRREILARLDALLNVDFRPGTGTTSLFTRSQMAKVTLSDGTKVQTKLVIAADGRNSPCAKLQELKLQPNAMGKGTGIRCDAPDSARKRFHRNPPHRWPIHLGAPARLQRVAMLCRGMDG